jgi:hypothetical protein
MGQRFIRQVVGGYTGTEIAALTNTRAIPATVFSNLPAAQIAAGEIDGVYYINDFTEGAYTLAANQSVTLLARGVYGATAGTAGTTISYLATAPYGVISLNATTDNEDAMIMFLGGANTAGQLVISTDMKLWFSVRLKTANITNAKYGIFVGLAEEGLCATTSVIGADGALTDKDYIGFHRLEADGDKFDIVYNTAGGGGQVVHLADACTIVADTYTELSIYGDGTNLYFYQDGVQVGTALAYDAAKVPDGEELAGYVVHMNAHADDASTQVDRVVAANIRG